MQKRSLVMLAHTYDSMKHCLNGWFISEKLDGQRCLWDGGITLGLPLRDIFWANIEKLERYVDQDQRATGLWTRYGHPIFAPSWWTESLPKIPLDGELWMGRGTFQELMSATRSLRPEDALWQNIRYAVFDGPAYTELFDTGEINEPHYKKVLSLAHFADFVAKYEIKLSQCFSRDFTTRMGILKQRLQSCKIGYFHEQVALSYDAVKATNTVRERLESVLSIGGEGLIARSPYSYWEPRRSYSLLKIKARHDAEGTVVGYNAAALGKLHGMVGAVVLRYGDIVFELSGFTDLERHIADPSIREMALSLPGCRLPTNYSHHLFPLGSRITFSYRELTVDGKPKEAAYVRKFAN